MSNKEYVIGIDIGSHSVVMAVGQRNDNGDLKILGVDVQDTGDSVKEGDIINFIELGNAISRAKTALEKELGRRFNSAYVGISGRSTYCVRYEDYVEINEKTGCVTERELHELNARIESVIAGGDDEIIERIPLRYRIDERQDVRNPIGAFGRKLSATYLFVVVGRQQIDRINRALYHAEMKASGLCVNPAVSLRTLLTKEEQEEGVAIVDIGSDLTDISIVRDGKLWYFSSLPIGASSINDDLREFLKISKSEIENLKRRYGSAMSQGVPENTTVPVKMMGHAKKQILQRNIAEITEERLKDIAKFVMRELKGAKFSTKLPCGVILTGGSAYLSNIEQLFAQELQMDVRLGMMLNGLDEESNESISAFSQSVVAGILLYGAEHKACDTMPGTLHQQPTQERVVPIVESSDKGIFSAPIEVPHVEEEPKPIVVQPQSEPISNPEPTVQQPEMQPQVQPANTPEEPIAQPASDVSKTPFDSTKKPEKGGSRWLDRFRSWVDGIFTEDEFIE